jgi:hypothetical protein
MKRNLPARARARVGYALRDVKKELDTGLEKALKVTTDPQARKQLIQDRRTILVALETASQGIEKQLEDQEKEEKKK